MVIATKVKESYHFPKKGVDYAYWTMRSIRVTEDAAKACAEDELCRQQHEFSLHLGEIARKPTHELH